MKLPNFLGVPLPWLAAGSALLFVLAACAWYLLCPQSAGPARTTAERAQGGKGAAGTAGPDALKLKEERMQALMERSRRRYLQLHPDFVPPAKSKAL
jgi:hypothetical protein